MKNLNCLVIAEAGNNHEGRLDVALELLERAKEAGADLVKFQAGKAEGFARNPEDPEQIKKYRRYELGRYGYNRLVIRGTEIGIPVFFSVWSPEFEDYNTLLWKKVAARQCTPIMVIRHDSPNTFISIPHTMTPKQIRGLDVSYGIPLHCVTEYPARNPMLERIGVIRKATGRKNVGYSDHTIGIKACVKAVKFGVVAVEKHFTLSHDFGPLRDHKLSATPQEMKEMVERIKS